MLGVRAMIGVATHIAKGHGSACGTMVRHRITTDRTIVTCFRCKSWMTRNPELRGIFDAVQENAAMAAKKRKASGVNIPETQRGTVQVKLRLPHDVADELDELSARWGLTRSGTVARMLEMVTDRQGKPAEGEKT